MSRRNNQIRKSELARALAKGSTVTDWAQINQVPDRTAYRWAGCRAVRDEVEAIRRDALDLAIGRLSEKATSAAEQIARLAEAAVSEAVRLQASRAVLAELMTVSSYAALEHRLAEIERRLKASRVECGGWRVEGTDRSEPASLHATPGTREPATHHAPPATRQEDPCPSS
jgi:hypothetical protein